MSQEIISQSLSREVRPSSSGYDSDDIVNSRYQAVVDEFEAQAVNPPGGDPYMREFYNAIYDMSKSEPAIMGLFKDALAARDLSPKHFVNLLFRGFQFIEINTKKNPDYPKSYTSCEDWRVEISDVMINHLDILKDILLTKETNTTIYQRYLGTHFVASRLLPEGPVKMADFGAGGRYGLRGMSAQIPFEEVDDNTGGLVNSVVRTPIQLREGLDIDLVDPDLPENVRWRLACSFYPSELGRYNEIVRFEERLRGVGNVRFFQRDILSVTVNDLNGNTTPKSYDAVILSTVLYQIPDQQDRVIENAKQLVSADGLIVVQDFAVKDNKNRGRLDFNVNWFGQNYTYRTFVLGERTNWEYKEVLHWKNGRCKEARKGEDLDKLILR